MAQGGTSLSEQFSNFTKLDDPKSDGKRITLTQLDKWLKQAEILDGTVITNTDTGICFNKFKSSTITYSQFVKFLQDLGEQKDILVDELKQKLKICGLPGTTKQTAKPAIGGLMDKSKIAGISEV